MPPKGKRQTAAQSSVALARVGGATQSEALSSFLGGFSVMQGEQEEREGAIVVNLRLLNKSNDMTKLKALVDLQKRCEDLEDERLANYVAAIVEATRQHVDHGNAHIRTALFELLLVVVRHGKPVKRVLSAELPTLAGAWIRAMHDMDISVQRAAQRCFDTAFSMEKREVMLTAYAEPIVRYLTETLEEVLMNPKPILDDAHDARGNAAFASLNALGFMVEQVSSTHHTILALLLKEALQPFFPVRSSGAPKQSFVANVPLVRSALLTLLRNVVLVCPVTGKLHQQIAAALHGSILERDPIVLQRVWELLLLWCKKYPTDALTAFPKTFLDDTVDSFMCCDRVEAAEIIFPSLLPLLALLSREGRLLDVVDEYCCALVEKVKQLRDTPNVSAREMNVCWQALMECWGLHHLRKKGTADADDSVELFTVIGNVLHSILSSDAKRQRYAPDLLQTVATNILKTSLRGIAVLRECLDILFQREGTTHRLLAKDATVTERVIQDYIACALLHEMIQLSSVTSDFAHAQPQLLQFANEVCEALLGGPGWDAVVVLLTGAHRAQQRSVSTPPGESVGSGLSDELGSAVGIAAPARRFIELSEEVQLRVVDELVRRLTEQVEGSVRSPPSYLSPPGSATPKIATPASPHSSSSFVGSLPPSPLIASPPLLPSRVAGSELPLLLDTALQWTKYPAVGKRLQAQLASVQLGWVQTAVKELRMSNPVELRGLLEQSCMLGAFDDVRRCAGRLAQMLPNTPLADEYRSAVTHAVHHSLNAALQLVQPLREDACDASRQGARSSSTATSGTATSGSSTEVTTDNDDDDNDDGVASHSDTGSDEEAVDNEGIEVCYRITQWSELLTRGSELAILLRLDGPTVVREFLPSISHLLALIAPQLFPEKYVSIKGLRFIMQGAAAATAGFDGDDDDRSEMGGDAVTAALSAKVHFVSMSDFNAAQTVVERLMQSYDIEAAALDDRWELFFREHVGGSGALAATGQLQLLVPLASRRLLQHLASDRALWTANRIATRLDDEGAALNCGTYSLSQLSFSMTTAVRTAQLVRLVDVSEAHKDADAVAMLVLLLYAASMREVFAEPIASLLMGKLLPHVVLRIQSDTNAGALLTTIHTPGDGANPALLCTLGHVLLGQARRCDIVASAQPIGGITLLPAATAALPTPPGITTVTRDCCSGDGDDADKGATKLPHVVQHLANAVGSHLVDAMFPLTAGSTVSDGLIAITPTTYRVYVAFFSLLDQIADELHMDFLSAVSTPRHQVMLEAVGSLPSFTPHVALLAVVVHRHLATKPVFADSTVRGVVELAQTQPPIAGLELLAEVTLARVINPNAYSDLIRAVMHYLSRCYQLHHLPSNGRLQLRDSRGPPVRIEEMQRVAVAAVTARRGVVAHNRLDDQLRSTVNLIVFDVICECVLRLRLAAEADIAPLARLIAYTAAFVEQLTPSDVAVLRASEASVSKLCSVLAYAYLWLAATPIAKLESIGLETVATMTMCVCLMSNLALMRSEMSVSSYLESVFAKQPTRRIRDHFTSAEPAKLNAFRKLNTVLMKTQKQRLVLFPYLLTWCVAVSGSLPFLDCPPKELKTRVQQVLDVVLTLLVTPTFPGERHLDNTFLLLPLSSGERLGFDFSGFCRAADDEGMQHLARGAASLLSLLLRQRTIGSVRSWMDTLERKLQALVYALVEDHISPILVQESLMEVLSKSPDGAASFMLDEGYTVAVSLSQRKVTLRYVKDDATVVVHIGFPTTFPLSQATVFHEGSRGSGVSEDQWRAWMLRMTSMLFGGTMGVWDCIKLLKANMDGHYAGVEPCPICYAVVSADNNRLPEMFCSVCRNSKFHSSCLYTWWSNNGNPQCPMCRSPWVST